MKKTLHSLLHRAGYQLNRFPFHSPSYLRHTARRLEHLASLRIPVGGMTVLEVGAGVGDFSHYYLDRGCPITITDARKSNIRYLRQRYPGEDVRILDLEDPKSVLDGPFDVIHCYGVLYHLGTPADALEFLGNQCRHLLFLETRVSFGDEVEVNLLAEESGIPSLSFSGTGCRPTRAWVYGELNKHFDHVYVPRTQPNHDEFPIDWRNLETGSGSIRAVFIASRSALDNPMLSSQLLILQERQA